MYFHRMSITSNSFKYNEFTFSMLSKMTLFYGQFVLTAVSKKSLPSLYSDLLFIWEKNFLDTQYIQVD